MLIQIKELGAIKEANIDLDKKLIVFCGPNGTGKTYMAYILYSLYKIENKSIDIRFPEESSKKLIENDTIEIELKLDEIWNYRIKEVSNLKENLWKLFAIPESIAKDFFSKTEINLLETKEDFIKKINQLSFDEHFKFQDYGFQILKLSKSGTLKLKIKEHTIKNTELLNFIEIILPSRIYTILAFYPITFTAFFPIERNSIFTFNNELSGNKNDTYAQFINISPLNLINANFQRSARYPEVIRDSLKNAEELELTVKRNSEYFDFASEIESELLCGKVIINQENGRVEFISNKATNIKLSFNQSSSIVKTLASLVIYLKHKASKNDLIFIDEPELNLHPDNQVKLARILSRMINNGLRLVVSTHSDYIIREFNNLVMVSSTNNGVEELAKKYNYRKDEFINKNEIGAYLFNYKNKNSSKTEAKAIKIDETGFEVETFDETTEKLNIVSDDLFYTIKYGKALS